MRLSRFNVILQLSKNVVRITVASPPSISSEWISFQVACASRMIALISLVVSVFGTHSPVKALIRIRRNSSSCRRSSQDFFTASIITARRATRGSGGNLPVAWHSS